jgi:hypothetical protein
MKISVETLPIGIPGMRDPDNRCSGYTPRKRIMGDAPADCESDGHYLCKECAFLEKKEPESHDIITGSAPCVQFSKAIK